jgi:hypothetical protein
VNELFDRLDDVRDQGVRRIPLRFDQDLLARLDGGRVVDQRVGELVKATVFHATSIVILPTSSVSAGSHVGGAEHVSSLSSVTIYGSRER